MNHDQTTPKSWRWIEDGPASGLQNMMKDESLALSAEPDDPPVLRVYGWRPFAISLGYHQPAEAVDVRRCEESGIDVVRRPTGGRAVLHAEELTYAVAIPSGHPFYRLTIPELHRRLALAIARALNRMGVPAELSRRAVDWSAHYRTTMAAGCFSAASKDEITLSGKKLVGSAQRRYPSAVLQHGSILLGDAHLKLPDYLAGLTSADRESLRGRLREKTVSLSGWGCAASRSRVALSLRSGFEEELGVRFASDSAELTSRPREAACRL